MALQGIDEMVLFNRALEQIEVQQLMHGWDSTFHIEQRDKLVTTWERIKSSR